MVSLKIVMSFFLLSLNLVATSNESNITSLNLYETATNRNFKILLNDQPLFLRIGRDNPAQVGIDREKEIAHYQLAEKLGLTPKLLAYDLDNGLLISEFIEGSNPSETTMHQVGFLQKVIDKLKLLHQCQRSDPNQVETNVFLRNDQLLQEFTALNNEEREMDKLQQWLTIRNSFEKDYYKGIPNALCHGDLFRGNLLEAKDGTLYLVDWEYSFFGPVVDDLGKLCSSNWLTDDEIHFVIRSYWGEITPALVLALKQNIYMQQINFYLWCKIQAFQNPKESGLYLFLASKTEAHLDQLGLELSKTIQ